MKSSYNLNSIEKIELMVPDNIDSLTNNNLNKEKKSLSKFSYKKLKLIPSFIIKKFYKILPGIIKDILFWS